jgi:glycine cleavage system H protein
VIPEDLKYTAEHEWVRRLDADTVRIGITEFAATQLGDVVHCEPPQDGADVNAGDAVGEVESTKSVSDIYTPLTGEVVATNEAVVTQAEKVNEDPYGDGWIFELRMADPSEFDELLDAAAYAKLTEQG